MSPTLHWRTGKDPATARCYGEPTTFGGRRDRGTGYLAHSDRVGPSVLVLHEFFGLTDSFRSYADAFCGEGFTALAPDLYDGSVAGSLEEATELARSLDNDKVMARLKAAAEHLRANWHPRLGIVGFSLGASLASALAQEVGAEACVLYYGYPMVDANHWSSPLLGHFADVDEWEDIEEVRVVFDALERAGHDAELHVYPGTGHWFANPDVPDAYRPEAAELAWHRTLDLLRAELA